MSGEGSNGLHNLDWVVLVTVGLVMLFGSKAEYEVVRDRINGGGGLLFFVCVLLSAAIVGVAGLIAAIFIGPMHGLGLAVIGALSLLVWTQGLRLLLNWRSKRR